MLRLLRAQHERALIIDYPDPAHPKRAWIIHSNSAHPERAAVEGLINPSLSFYCYSAAHSLR
jgi:hypothetical protein